ncbi:MAG: DUF11 domain-containing protein [Zetaproteobacteria bacterium]|nr:MAG: DUF11 domain-containing protein [Zetaproteobacteria bacterium]
MMLAALCVRALSAFAVGTPAGTTITNQATVNYKVGQTAFTKQSNQTQTTVAQVTDVVVTTVTTNQTVQAGTTGYVAVRVTNTGNGADSFALTASAAPGAGYTPTFPPAANAFAVDANNNGVYDPGTDPYVNQAAGLALNADAYATVFAFFTPPANAPDGASAGIVVTATSNTAKGAPGTVVLGRGVNGVDAVAGGNGGQGSNQGAPAVARVSNVSISVSKSVQVISDPYTAPGGTPQPIPGAVLQYTLTVTATGTATATNVVVTDPIPANTTYQVGTIKLDGVAQTDVKDQDAADYNATNRGAITVNLGNVPGGATHTITFKVKIQ